MIDYKEFTFGWLIFIFLIPIHLLLTYLYFNGIGEEPIGTNSYILISLAFIIAGLLFYGLTTKITSDSIIVSFGVGLIRKKIDLNRVKTVDTVKSPWYYGWGIRIIPRGILFNISGSEGVELKFKDTDTIIRIGTKESQTLKQEIEKRMV